MSALARVGGLFVESPPPARAMAPAAGPLTPPTIAVLCAAPRGPVAVAAVSLALAHLLGRPYALEATVGTASPGAHAGAAVPSAQRAARRLRERGMDASASGRLVWLADRRCGELGIEGRDAPGAVAAANAELGRAAMIADAPAAIAIPLARVDALDRVLGWHDGIVVVPEPGLTAPMREHVLASLALLGRPVACMAPPPRLAGTAALLGLRAPACALDAVSQLVHAT